REGGASSYPRRANCHYVSSDTPYCNNEVYTLGSLPSSIPGWLTPPLCLSGPGFQPRRTPVPAVHWPYALPAPVSRFSRSRASATAPLPDPPLPHHPALCAARAG